MSWLEDMELDLHKKFVEQLANTLLNPDLNAIQLSSEWYPRSRFATFDGQHLVHQSDSLTYIMARVKAEKLTLIIRL